MSTLVSITTKPDPGRIDLHWIHSLSVLVLYPHNQCNCRCVMCDIWRIREAKQITPADAVQMLPSLKQLGVRWVVLSGGEPQLNEKWSWLAHMLRSAGSRVTLLTSGLLLNPQAQRVAETIDDVIVSLDGPPAVHNSIRRIPDAFERMAKGVRALREIRPEMEIRARCTVQKANHHSLRAVVAYARQIGLTSVSFLAADLTSSAFNRQEGWSPHQRDRVSLNADEVEELELEIERLITQELTKMGAAFVVERPEKLRRIVRHFRAHVMKAHPAAPRCNAPWVSAVIDADGDVRPCFFHAALGNIHRQPLADILNGPGALEFRSNLDIASNETCRRCVCSLYLSRDDELSAPTET
jgi:MoaA/NifB/PqqE/SkfB family radical SAM enzyme